MNKSARIVGVLFIIGTVAGILSAVLTGPVFEAPDVLVEVSTNESQIIAAALLVLTMGLALAMIPVVAFPVLRQHNQVLALGYVLFRGALEPFTYMATVVSWLLLIVLSRGYVQAGGADAVYSQTLGSLLLGAGGQVNHVLQIVFPLGALMFYAVLYRSRLVPRWLSAWGLVGIALHFGEGLLTMFGVLPAGAETIAALPIALQEMVLAVWLIVKGFSASVTAPEAAHSAKPGMSAVAD